jgi:hypothetical protein
MAAVVAAGAAIAAAGVAAAALSGLETYGAPGWDLRLAPAWAAPCAVNEPRHDRELLAPCARATGVVAHVRVQGSGEEREVHLALVGEFGVLIVKLGDPQVLPTPAVGERVHVVGALVRASNGMREIQAWSLG